MKHRRAPIALALVCAASAVVFARTDVRITPIVSEGRVLVSFEARDAWTLAAREALQASLDVRFEYEVALKQPEPLWFFDRVLARVRVSSSARFDTLSGRYNVSRMRNGHVFKSDRRDQESEVREWLTTFDQVALDPITPPEPNAEYYVYVALTISPRRNVSLWSLLPFGREDNAGRKYFTYIR